MKILETVKSHPYLTAGGVFVVGVILVLMLSGTDSEVVEEAPAMGGYYPSGPSDAAVAANSMLAQGQLQAQVASKQLDNELAALKDNNATAFNVAKENFQYLTNKDVVASQVAIRGIQASEYESNLAAKTAANNNATAAQIALASYDRDKAVAGLAAGVENNKTNAFAAVTNAANAQAYELGRMQIGLEHIKSTQAFDLANAQRNTDYQKALLGYSATAYLKKQITF